ncbi:MAG: dienelactone hydrolase family protein, partial [Chthoniobacterales bacterium]
MKRAIIAIGLVAAMLAMAEAIKDFGRERLNSSPRHADWVDIKPDLKAFVVYPERKEKAPVVIVISEIFGLTDWVR